MHYIVGTKITCTPSRPQPLRPGMTSSQIKNRSTGLTTFTEQREQLTSGVEYTLIRVYIKEEKVCYAFAGNGERVELLFDSVTDAEKFISELRRETIPDYEELNKYKSD